MTAAGWTLAIVAAWLFAAGAFGKKINKPRLDALKDEIAALPSALRKAVDNDSDNDLLLGLGIVCAGAALITFMLASLFA